LFIGVPRRRVLLPLFAVFDCDRRLDPAADVEVALDLDPARRERGDEIVGDLRDPALAWSPDGTLIAFTSNGAKSFRNVSVVESSGGTAQPVSFLANGQTASRIAWSPDGKYLLFNTAQRGEQSKMARVDLQPHLPRFRED
jgi:dipeptidyl aminopeptidase/acylaminoacyl peptidase